MTDILRVPVGVMELGRKLLSLQKVKKKRKLGYVEA